MQIRRVRVLARLLQVSERMGVSSFQVSTFMIYINCLRYIQNSKVGILLSSDDI